jgi:hypothetical protein
MYCENQENIQSRFTVVFSSFNLYCMKACNLNFTNFKYSCIQQFFDIYELTNASRTSKLYHFLQVTIPNHRSLTLDVFVNTYIKKKTQKPNFCKIRTNDLIFYGG